MIVSNVEELFVALALVLIVVGIKDVWRPGAFIVPGVVLLWIFLPARTGFIVSSRADDKRGRT